MTTMTFTIVMVARKIFVEIVSHWFLVVALFAKLAPTIVPKNSLPVPNATRRLALNAMSLLLFVACVGRITVTRVRQFSAVKSAKNTLGK